MPDSLDKCGYALPVGNGEADAVGLEDGTAVADGTALGRDLGWPRTAPRSASGGGGSRATHPLSLLETGT